MMSFTNCELQFSHKKTAKVALLEGGHLVAERDGKYIHEMYISGPDEFKGHWVDANIPPFIEAPYLGIVGLTGIVYRKNEN